MKSTIIWLFLFLISANLTYAQKQTLKGQVVDKSTGAPIVGAAVILGQDSIQLQVTTSDFDGNFRFAELPFGRYYIDVQFIGYTPHRENDVYVRGGNQTVLILRLSETSYSLDELVLTAV